MFVKIVLMFMLYGFLGYVYEMIHMRITTKELVNRGFLNGPIIPVYAVGSLLIIFLLDGIKSNFILTVFLITIICSVTEYITSLILEKIFKIRWWDYSDKAFNIQGRVCPNTMIQFVILAIVALYIINPYFMNMLSGANEMVLNITSFILIVLFISDFIFSNAVVINFLKTDTGDRLDKTSAIRKYTKTYVKGKVSKKFWFI